MKDKNHCLANVRFPNGSNKVAMELQVVQFWSEIILVISNGTRAARSFHFEITRMISDQIALHSVQSPLLIITKPIHKTKAAKKISVDSRNSYNLIYF